MTAFPDGLSSADKATIREAFPSTDPPYYPGDALHDATVERAHGALADVERALAVAPEQGGVPHEEAVEPLVPGVGAIAPEVQSPARQGEGSGQ
ncbi:MAG: hypothetical protein R3324_05900, partial [Halobacteriales archaeon]|nr:hypothetical protein [Halobacteriales archaeon]